MMASTCPSSKILAAGILPATIKQKTQSGALEVWSCSPAIQLVKMGRGFEIDGKATLGLEPTPSDSAFFSLPILIQWIFVVWYPMGSEHGGGIRRGEGENDTHQQSRVGSPQCHP